MDPKHNNCSSLAPFNSTSMPHLHNFIIKTVTSIQICNTSSISEKEFANHALFKVFIFHKYTPFPICRVNLIQCYIIVYQLLTCLIQQRQNRQTRKHLQYILFIINTENLVYFWKQEHLLLFLYFLNTLAVCSLYIVTFLFQYI